jgi:hypothetical protein
MMILGFFLAIWLLGFVVAVPLATFLYFRFAGGEKWSISIPLSLVAGAISMACSIISSTCLSLREHYWRG